MKNKKFPILLCLLALVSVFSHAFSAVAQSQETYTVSDVVDDQTLKGFVEHAASSLQGATTFSETLMLLNDFRDDEGNWNDGDTYLILLTKDGGVYVHAKDREQEDQDWSDLKDAAGKNVGQEFLRAGGFVEYTGDGGAGKAYAFSFIAPSVPFSNPSVPEERGFVLIGGFDYEPAAVSQKASYEELAGELSEFQPTKEAKDIGGEGDLEKDKGELKVFVEEAIVFFTGALVSKDVDPVRLRTLFRLEGGPWRHVSTYIYIMDEKGNVIFNGANRNIEQTNLLNDPEVGDIIGQLLDAARMPGGGFVEYNWENPAVEGDGEQEGGPGGNSPKLGYTKAFSANKEDPSAPVYVFGSGLYLGQGEKDGGGGCSISGTENAVQGASLSLLLVVLAVFSVVLIRRGTRMTDRRTA